MTNPTQTRQTSSEAAAILSDLESVPMLPAGTDPRTYAMECVQRGENQTRFRFRHPVGGWLVSARADLFTIRSAWDAGCSFESMADGFGRGLGTMGGDWSGIRDSSEPAIAAMAARALPYLLEIR